MSEWVEVTLNDIGLLQRGKSKHRPRYAYHLYGGPYPFVQTGQIKSARKYIREYEQTYSEAGLKQSKLWKKGTLCITIAANIAEIGILDFDACFPDSVIGFVPNESKADLDFIYYLLQHFQRELKHRGEGSVQDNINLGTFRDIAFPIPELNEQKAITAVLTPLDDKIDLLHRQNKTLESIAQTLFRHWFIDGADDDWEDGCLGDISENIRDGVKHDQVPNGTIYIGLEHIDKKCIALNRYGLSDDINSNKYRFVEEDVLFGKLRPYFHKVCFTPFSGICSTDILVLRPKKPYYFCFSLFAFYQKDVIEYANLGSGGTRMPRTNWNTLKEYPIFMPPENVIKQFNDMIYPSIKKIRSNLSQIHTLEQLRDALLPKLMNGVVRVRL